jgi:ferredoxin
MTTNKAEETAGSMRVYADRQLCCGYAACKEACPEIFQIDDEGLVTILHEVVPPALEKAATEAVDSCPMRALRMEKDES